MIIMTISSQVKETLSSLKNIKSTLDVYVTRLNQPEVEKVYKQAIEKTQEIINDLENRVKTLELEERQYKGN